VEQAVLEAQGIDWPDIYFSPINLWNMPYMTPKEAVELTNMMMDKGTSPCQKKCKLDVWRERCISCRRTLNQIKETYVRSIDGG
jgi:hypothetical protein